MTETLKREIMIRIDKLKGQDDLSDCLAIRRHVFIHEQNVPEELEIDNRDFQAVHYLVYLDNHPIGTARIRFPNKEQAKIERVAILSDYRGRGFGRQLMSRILSDLRQDKTLKTVILGAQIEVIDFYEKFGFKAAGKMFWEAGIQHRMMQREL